MNMESPERYTCLVVLGPTAVGKTALAVRLADAFNGEIISADSRQVYRGLDIGSGKDLCEYKLPSGRVIPYHLIDIADVSAEYSVYNYQRDFYRVFPEITARHKLPVVCGGTGMYLDSVIRGYRFSHVPENAELRARLAEKSLEELAAMLRELKHDAGTELHNSTDTDERHRVIRAIEIAVFDKQDDKLKKDAAPKRPDIRPFIIGTKFSRAAVRRRARERLRARMKDGLLDEVRRLHENGADWERLDRLGLEYRFAASFLRGQIQSEDELFETLAAAICRFIKRQETWFRGMERKGVCIHWLPFGENEEDCTADCRAQAALKMIADERCCFDI
ncbi:MAG: tRNA (adenosine(37)-N6)-dimethylallyltransferase MiaA [Bacteroides sp.]|nr:tRNA (adenosine(37)-N6)-dimethylallyltransferase MiaA [Prevotella sp.]MCM1408178.1 tRNA (adenosine(37)-N6)-dimethylallyltransferase MiaA [Treponema brennaborense]MCM1469502.1 tRNA (adenosine(37)-N6)-dimethylallyltransferase MiaA [Bacteroides sp.]